MTLPSNRSRCLSIFSHQAQVLFPLDSAVHCFFPQIDSGRDRTTVMPNIHSVSDSPIQSNRSLGSPRITQLGPLTVPTGFVSGFTILITLCESLSVCVHFKQGGAFKFRLVILTPKVPSCLSYLRLRCLAGPWPAQPSA